MKKLFIIVLTIIMIMGIVVTVSAETEQVSYHYNLQSMSGKYTKNNQDNVTETIYFDTGDFPLSTSSSTIYPDGKRYSMYSKPYFTITGFELYDVADVGDLVTIKIKFPQLTASAEYAIDMLKYQAYITGENIDDEKTELQISYDYLSNQIVVTEEYDGWISPFGKLFDNIENTTLYNDNNEIIGCEIKGSLRAKIIELRLCPMIDAEKVSNYYNTAVNWNSYDDFEITVEKEIEVTEPTRIISAGMYTFNETPVLPSEDLYIHFATPALISYNDGISMTIYECQRMMINTQTLVYNVIQPSVQSITAYTEPPFVNAGWAEDQYRQITIVNDIEVSQTVYDWFIANTTPPPEYKGTYVFYNDGIKYEQADGMGPFLLIGTYYNEATMRVDVENTYCAMYYDSNGTLHIVSSEAPFRNDGNGTITNNPIKNINHWIVVDEKIIYDGTVNSYVVTEWEAGNNSILFYDNDNQYHGFDKGMKSVEENITEDEEEEEKGILDILLDVFYPEDYVSAKWLAMRDKFKFADSIAKTAKLIFDFLANTDFNTPPQIEINFGLAESKYNWGSKAMVLDMSWYARYKPTIDAFLTSWIWIVFVVRTFVRLPSIIGGVSSDFDMHNKKNKK